MKAGKGELWIAVSIAGFAVSDLFDRVAMFETSAILGTLIKCSIILLFGICIHLISGEKYRFSKYFVISGIVSELLGSAFFMYGLKFGVSVVLPMIQTQVIWTAIFSYFILKERLAGRGFLPGMIALVVGLIILTYGRYGYAPTDRWYLGAILGTLASVGWGCGAVMWKRGQIAGVSPSSGIVTHYLTAVIALGIISVGGGLLIPIQVSGGDLFNLGIAALLDGVLGMYALMASLRYISATRAQSLKSFYPVIACVLAWFIIRDPLNWQMLLGICIATAGVILIERGGRGDKD